jgi:uncharacterized protein (TIGR03067 family)
MQMRILSLSLLLGIAATAAQGDPASKKDLELMQGMWKVVELTEEGQKLAQKELTPVEVFILGNKMAIHDDGKFREEITLKLDAAKKIKAVDFVYTKGMNTGKTERGIYAFEGDTLKFCMNEGKDGARPTKFLSTKANKCSIAVLQRAKK